ncbi:hypothetical protein PQR71_42205 [Paraburkholderia fungorum]|uniref:hypothetical protein n=1 Tax=Paraburkholderia fungorum TaxID=134537 RepID=UPI0038BA12FF
MTVEQTHELKDTLTVDVLVAGHEPRTTTTLFKHTKKDLYEKVEPALTIPRDQPGRCWICGQTEAELGAPLEAHHFGIERSYAEADLRWDRIKADFPHWDWSQFDPANPYTFVDNMEAQGVLLCKTHHTGRDSGIHNMPFGLWILQRYLKDGTRFSPTEVIHHDPEHL